MSGDRGSVSGVLVCWSLDLGSTPDRSLSFSFPLDHLGLSMLTSKLNTPLFCSVRGGSRGGLLGSNEPPFHSTSGSLLLPAVFDTQRLRTSPVWLLTVA